MRRKTAREFRKRNSLLCEYPDEVLFFEMNHRIRDNQRNYLTKVEGKAILILVTITVWFMERGIYDKTQQTKRRHFRLFT